MSESEHRDINTMTDAEKTQEKFTIAIYTKMATFMTSGEEEAKSSLGSHKSHLGRTRAAAEKALKAVENIPYIASIKNIERCMEASYAKAGAMKLAFKHLLIIDPTKADRWERDNEIKSKSRLRSDGSPLLPRPPPH